MHVFAIRTEIYNWITNDLAEAVIGDLAAAIRFKDSNAALAQYFLGRDYSPIGRAPAQRQCMRVLEQK
jgi:hypothetical protein